MNRKILAIAALAVLSFMPVVQVFGACDPVVENAARLWWIPDLAAKDPAGKNYIVGDNGLRSTKCTEQDIGNAKYTTITYTDTYKLFGSNDNSITVTYALIDGLKREDAEKYASDIATTWSGVDNYENTILFITKTDFGKKAEFDFLGHWVYYIVVKGNIVVTVFMFSSLLAETTLNGNDGIAVLDGVLPMVTLNSTPFFLPVPYLNWLIVLIAIAVIIVGICCCCIKKNKK